MKESTEQKIREYLKNFELKITHDIRSGTSVSLEIFANKDKVLTSAIITDAIIAIIEEEDPLKEFLKLKSEMESIDWSYNALVATLNSSKDECNKLIEKLLPFLEEYRVYIENIESDYQFLQKEYACYLAGIQNIKKILQKEDLLLMFTIGNKIYMEDSRGHIISHIITNAEEKFKK